jgi:predicted Fe-S protein YdhL (DUF1289 family)
VSRNLLEFDVLPNQQGVKSPCVRNCCLDDGDICMGCFRSLDEIKVWGQATDEERTAILILSKQRRADNKKRPD